MRRFAVTLTALALVACSGGEETGAQKSTGTEQVASAMPKACDILRDVKAGEVLGAEPTFEQQSDVDNGDISNSMCIANVDGGAKSLSLSVRVDKTGVEQKSGADQAAAIVETLGIEPEPADVGEHAFWAPKMRQLNVWYREGRVYLIVSGSVDKDQATAFARKIISAYP